MAYPVIQRDKASKQRNVDLATRKGIETSRNYLRRKAIPADE